MASQARDQIGHWVAPSSARQKPCPHRCCEWKHPHPANLPVKLNRSYLRSLSQEDLERELIYYQRYSDTHEAGYLQIIAEDTRREESREKSIARMDRRKQRAAQRREEWTDEVYRQWLGAENATNGYMLNKAGKAKGIDERRLFTGPESQVDRYASDELKEYFQSHPRPTRARILGRGADRRDRMEGAIWGHDPGHF
jgi:hypothetical protein